MTIEEIERIEIDYKRGLKYKEIEDNYKISHNQLLYLIRKNEWKRKSNRSEVQKGNKNAKGNKGGHAPLRNKNAVITGEYESIFSEFYSDEERKISQKIKDIDEIKAIEQDIELYTIKECRILKKISELKNDGEDMAITSITQNETYIIRNNKYTTKNISTFAEDKNVKILRLEEALTRIQQARVKALSIVHKIKIDKANLEFKKYVFEINNKDNKKENIDKIQDYLNKLEGVFKHE